jgi:hypothetical protein
MPAGKLHRYKRRKRMLPQVPKYKSRYSKHKGTVATARRYKKNYKQQNGLASMRPITRRPYKLKALHVYQNTASVNIGSWQQLYIDGNAQTPTKDIENILQIFSINTPQIFDDGGSIDAAKTGNLTNSQFPNNPRLRVEWDELSSDTWTSGGGATMVPGYDSAPSLREQFYHQQVIGAEYYFNIRSIDATGSGELSTFVPMKVLLVPCSTASSITPLDTIEDIMKMPRVQCRIISGTNGGGNSGQNTNAVLRYKHSIRKFNGLPKGQFIGDSRYLGASNLDQNVVINQNQNNLGNAPSEQDHLFLIFAPLSSSYGRVLPTSCKSPTLHIEMKIKKWIQYTDPNMENQQIGPSTQVVTNV